jgi:hypothetical protein
MESQWIIFFLMSQAMPTIVYLGRGSNCYNKPGTKKYRNIIKQYAQDFCPNATKSHKTDFIDYVWSQMYVQGFHFVVSSNSEDNQIIWEEISIVEAKRRIGHALRDHRKRYFERKEKPNNESNSQAESLKQILQNINSKVMQNDLNRNQNSAGTFESLLPLKDHQDNRHDVTNPTFKDICGGRIAYTESDDYDLMKASLSDVKECLSKEGQVSCNVLTSSNVRECYSLTDSSGIAMLVALDENLKGNESSIDLLLFLQ